MRLQSSHGNPTEVRAGSYLVSTDPSRLDLGLALSWLRGTAWAGSLTAEDPRIAVDNSLCAGTYLGSEQVGFARLVTDFATYGYLTDVYVDGGHRGYGLARRMSRVLLEHDSVARVEHFVLIASGNVARSVYEGIGFMRLTKPETWLELRR